MEAFEVAGYQIVGKSGKSMDSVSRCDVLQRIRRGEQANLSIFAIMICLVAITGMFGPIIVLSLFADAHRLQEKPEKCLSETGRASCADRWGPAAGGMSAGERQH